MEQAFFFAESPYTYTNTSSVAYRELRVNEALKYLHCRNSFMYTHKNKQAICNQPLTGLVTSLFSLSFCSHILFQFFSTPVLSLLFSFSLVASCLFLFSLPSVYTVCSTHFSIFVIITGFTSAMFIFCPFSYPEM